MNWIQFLDGELISNMLAVHLSISPPHCHPLKCNFVKLFIKDSLKIRSSLLYITENTMRRYCICKSFRFSVFGSKQTKLHCSSFNLCNGHTKRVTFFKCHVSHLQSFKQLQCKNHRWATIKFRKPTKHAFLFISFHIPHTQANTQVKQGRKKMHFFIWLQMKNITAALCSHTIYPLLN